MKGLIKKPIKILLVIGILLILFSPLYMYFSADVNRLKSEYPHLNIKNKTEVEIEIKHTRPAHWVKLKDISRYGKWAIILSEDWAFYQHEGVDMNQVKVALEEMVHGNRFRGASTITQQMVKNVYLSESRTIWRKLHEYILSQKVEKVLSKDRILEIYLNSIEYGPGIFGIKAAAQHYFKKSPAGLTPREGAWLALLLPSPKRYYISFKKKKLTPFARIRMKAILTKLRMGKIITPDQYAAELGRKFIWEK